MTTANPTRVTVWWTAPCGATHTATDPPTIGACPDGLDPTWSEEEDR